MIAQAGPQNFFGLGEYARDLVQSRDVVFIVFQGVQRDGERQIGEFHMRPAHLIERHLEFLEPVIVDAPLQHPHEDFVRQRSLRRKSAGRDLLDPRQEFCVGCVIGRRRCQRIFVQAIVIAVVPIGGRGFRGALQFVLILLLEQRVLRREARLDAG